MASRRSVLIGLGSLVAGGGALLGTGAFTTVTAERPVHFDGAVRDTRVYQREQLPAAGSFTGPAIVEGAESTVVVRPEQSVQVDEYGSLIVEVQS
ncbi:hypothetical protein EXE42_16375 [Halorubrum sp. SP3]|uniref:hypothetical protein n=1 Tax=Halorubrum sp. SP3 TaxID=1537265 RepID=UPI0010F6A37B|nr:hypothetical protein [Halorubrum sp. SP3]TKX52394.1 hypothetical protein EXE42_16375 [Halorubrum sp. SP3]